LICVYILYIIGVRCIDFLHSQIFFEDLWFLIILLSVGCCVQNFQLDSSWTYQAYWKCPINSTRIELNSVARRRFLWLFIFWISIFNSCRVELCYLPVKLCAFRLHIEYLLIFSVSIALAGYHNTSTRIKLNVPGMLFRFLGYAFSSNRVEFFMLMEVFRSTSSWIDVELNGFELNLFFFVCRSVLLQIQ
jgi:hypothetical protein